MINNKIILLCNYYAQGGAQKNAARISRKMRQRGYDPTLVFMEQRDEFVNFDGSPKYKILQSKLPFIFRKIQLIFKTFQMVRRDSPIAIYGFYPASNVFSALFARRSTRVIATIRNPVVLPEANHAQGMATQSKLFGLIDKVLGTLGGYDKIICVSDDVKSSCSNYPKSYKKNLITIYNAVDKMSEPSEDISSFKHRNSLTNDIKWVGFLGRVHAQKNPKFLLEIFRHIDDPTIRIAIAGDGPELDELKSLALEYNIEDRIHSIGMIDKEQIPNFLRSINLLLIPSNYEGFGLTQIEAMSEGCPVIANDISIMREIGDGASLCLPLDAKMWAMHIQDIVSDRVKHHEMQLRGYERYRYFNNEDAMIDKYLAAAGLPSHFNFAPV